MIGNEVTNATDFTLTRTGAGTTASPYTLGINPTNPNTWIGEQTFGGGAKFPGNGIWDAAGNVGIGTTLPIAKLEINGGIVITNIKTLQISATHEYTHDGGVYAHVIGAKNNLYSKVKKSSDPYNVISFQSNSIIEENAGDVNQAIGVQGFTYNSSTNTLSKAYGISGIAQNDSIGIINEAIGVNGCATVASGTINNGYGGRFLSANAIKNVGIYASAEGGTNNYAAIFDKGNVGIGTTSPSTKLEVNGNVKIASGGSANKVVCWKSDGKTLGYCSSIVGADGSCTCN